MRLNGPTSLGQSGNCLQGAAHEYPREHAATSGEVLELCLHDALVVSRSEHIQPAGECRIDLPFPVTFPGMWTAVAIMSVTIGWEVVLLIYSLSDCTTAKEAPQGWRLSKLQEQWLYDEVDLINDRTGPFVHRIMFSTGVTLEIHFTAVIIHKFTLPAAAKQAKQSDLNDISWASPTPLQSRRSKPA